MIAFVETPYESWGRVARSGHAIATPSFADEMGSLLAGCDDHGLLAVGHGRSYGDSGLNSGGKLVVTTRLDRILEFDGGRLRAEAGLSLSELLKLVVPRGYFLPTTPGTRFVTLGGAVANDVHGKNHHAAGSFGCSVSSFTLHRSDRPAPFSVTRESNPELFAATIGGLGLTGIITEVALDLAPIASAWLDVERIAFGNVREFFPIARESEATHEHTVAWIDCSSTGATLGRGIFQRANWCRDGELAAHDDKQLLTMPADAPSGVLNRLTISSFNAFYYRLQRRGRRHTRVHYAPFFYPLDTIGRWNRLYGRDGFYQYQCVIPPEAAEPAIEALLKAIAKSGQGSFLAVLKTFGPRPSPGLLSFPASGTTLALDFANKGDRTLRLLDTLDRIVLEARGRLYPAKDGRMPAAMFQKGYPHWRRLAALRDPKLISDFWRRVSAE